MGVPLRQLSSQESPEVVEKQIRSLLMEGRILEAQHLLASAGSKAPIDPKLREVLAPAKVRKSDARDVDRSAEFRWLKTHAAEYQGHWVALLGENLVAASEILQELLAQLEELQLEGKPLIHHLV
jgi:hypothetical protein